MSWVLSPSRLHALPPEAVNTSYWTGVTGTADEGLFRFQAEDGRFCIATTMYTQFRSGTVTLECNPAMDVNGYAWWGNVRGGWRIWKDSTGTWVLTDSSIPLGADPLDDLVTIKKDDGTTETIHYGDAFYTASGSVPEVWGEWVFKAAGTLLNDDATKDDTKTFKRELRGWYSANPLGVYDKAEGVDGTRTFGTPYWTISNGKSQLIVKKSIEKDAKGYFRYGPIHHDGQGWVIGVRSEDGGYWEGEEPQAEQGFSFRRVKSGDDDEEKDYTGTWVAWNDAEQMRGGSLVAGELAFL